MYKTYEVWVFVQARLELPHSVTIRNRAREKLGFYFLEIYTIS